MGCWLWSNVVRHGEPSPPGEGTYFTIYGRLYHEGHQTSKPHCHWQVFVWIQWNVRMCVLGGVGDKRGAQGEQILTATCKARKQGLDARHRQLYSASRAGTLGCSVVPDSFVTPGLWPARLLCPWGSPGKNLGVGRHFLLQGIFLTQGSNPRLLLGGRALGHWATWEAQIPAV